jgi:hypothetical protein
MGTTLTKLAGPATKRPLHRKPPRYARDTGPIEALWKRHEDAPT